MQKNENTVVLATVLLVITALVAFLLASVNSVTSEKIRIQSEREQIEARSAVLSAATAFVELPYQVNDDSPVAKVFKGLSGETMVGYCVQVSPVGYGGEIDMVVGITQNGTIEAVRIISMTETPGLGAKAQEESFIGQFAGKNGDTPLQIVKGSASAENEITAISGATITSRAVTDGIYAAVEAVRQMGGLS